jgi:hypothetical protein
MKNYILVILKNNRVEWCGLTVTNILAKNAAIIIVAVNIFRVRPFVKK